MIWSVQITNTVVYLWGGKIFVHIKRDYYNAYA